MQARGYWDVEDVERHLAAAQSFVEQDTYTHSGAHHGHARLLPSVPAERVAYDQAYGEDEPYGAAVSGGGGAEEDSEDALYRKWRRKQKKKARRAAEAQAFQTQWAARYGPLPPESTE